MKTNANKRTTRATVVIILLVVAVIGYYCYLINRPAKGGEEKELTPMDEVLLRNMTNDYPQTVKEVIKYHNEINKCLYNEKCDEKTFDDLTKRDRELYDIELLTNNEWDTQKINLLAEVTAFQKAGRKLTGARVGASTDVDYFEKDGHSFARIPCSYTVMERTDSTTTMHIYLLRKDVTGHWKIFGWELADNLDEEPEEQIDNTEG